MIKVENINKSFGNYLLFEDVNFTINQNEKIGLVGRNGHGKTTLFKIITGQEQPDKGSIVIPKNYTIGYLRQDISFKEDTILKEGMRGLPAVEKDHHWKVEKILSGLGFSNKDMERHPSEFSGGYQVRLNLSKILVSDFDILLLDEPTNYLDITSIRWIERFLINWPRQLMLITHDRGFMDKVVTHVVGIHRKIVRKIPGDTEKFYSQIAQEETVFEKTRQNDERQRKEIEQFINRFRAKARLANMVQSRIKLLDKKEKKDKLEKLKILDFSFKYKYFSTKYALTAKNISFSYEDGKLIIDDFNLVIGANDRICIVGKNGKGKTTLLKLLAGIIKPRYGEVKYHPAAAKGVFEQTNVMNLVAANTVEEEIMSSAGDIDKQQARNICGSMMFEGDWSQKKIEVLSGGEKSRVMLGKILAAPANILLLDEPTNHLDMESCDALLYALDAFDGAIVMVTHNEMFLHALAQRLIVFKQDELCIFEGSYQEFLDKGGWNDDEAAISKNILHEKDDKDSCIKLNKKEVRRKRSEVIAERAKILKPMEMRISELENFIESQENYLNQQNSAMIEASQKQDGTKIREVAQEIHKCQRIIDNSFNELAEITEAYEKQNAFFENKLNN